MLSEIVRAAAWLSIVGGTGVFVFVQWQNTHGRLELVTGGLMLLLFARIIKRAAAIAGAGTAVGGLGLSLLVTAPAWQWGLIRVLGDPRHATVLTTTHLWVLYTVVLVLHAVLRHAYVPLKPGHRGIVEGETPEQSLSRIAVSYRGKRICLDWDHIVGKNRAFTDLARSVARAVQERLQREGAEVVPSAGQAQYVLSFSWMDQPMFTFRSSVTGEQSSLRPVRWAGRRPWHMKEDAAVQGLYFLAVFITEGETRSRSAGA